MANLSGLVENDEYFTPKEVWMDVLHYLDLNRTYLDPFYGNGDNINNLKELGLNCIGCNLDCFELLRNLDFDVIITNSPFSRSILTEFLYNLEALQKPFIIILPITKIFSKYFRTAFRSYSNIQIIIPRKRLSFIDPTNPNKRSNPSFCCCYLTYKLNLPSDIIFL